MRYYLLAGERSGDLHGANLLKGIRQADPQAEFRAWGGDLMQAEGAELVTHYTEMAFMGFWEVVKHAPTIWRLMRKCKRDLLEYKPDVLILIDYPGFNLRMAAFAKQQGIRVFYYISPKVWAWNQRRAWKIKATVDELFVIFPFEVPFYQRYDFEVRYHGNPIVDALTSFSPKPNFRTANQLDSRPILALLPGSRTQEVKAMLPTMLRAATQFEGYQVVVAGVNSLPRSLYEPFEMAYPSVRFVYDQTYDAVTAAQGALVTSGTATLEVALLGVPQVVCYRASPISFQIAKRLIRVPFISLVNLIMEREVVRELIQHLFHEAALVAELKEILPGGERNTQVMADYAELKKRVGEAGASLRVGREMVALLSEPAH